MTDLTGYVAVVTGGNRGIGFGLAEGLVAAYLADPTLVFHTGDSIVVDGGYTVF